MTPYSVASVSRGLGFPGEKVQLRGFPEMLVHSPGGLEELFSVQPGL